MTIADRVGSDQNGNSDARPCEVGEGVADVAGMALRFGVNVEERKVEPARFTDMLRNPMLSACGALTMIPTYRIM